jgi:hypothetical protein
MILVDIHPELIPEHVGIENDSGVTFEAFTNHPSERNASSGYDERTPDMVRQRTYKLCRVLLGTEPPPTSGIVWRSIEK